MISIVFSFVLSSKERQFRIEQREADGSVKGRKLNISFPISKVYLSNFFTTGQYGYIDNNGKMHLTKYSASEAEGFKAEEVPT